MLAAFWVLLAGFSGTYLYRIVTGEAVEGSEIDHVGAILDEAEPNALSPEQAAALLKFAEVQRKELSALKTSLSNLSQQVADLSEQNDALNSRLKPLEKIFGTPSGGAVTTSPPAPPAIAALNPPQPVETAKPEEEPAQAAAPPPAEAAASPEAPAQDEAEPPTEAPAGQAEPEPSAETPAAQAETSEDAAEETESAETPAAQTSEDGDSAETPPPPPAAVTTDEPAEASQEEETEVAAVRPALNLPPGTTRFGIELGTVDKQEGLRPLWREMLNNHAALVAGLQARRVLAPDKKWRLIAGPFASAEEAIQACVLFKRANRSCEATVFAGDAL